MFSTLNATKLIILSGAFICLSILSIVVNTIYGYDIVYTHLFYIPIILSCLWFPRHAVFVALAFSVVHIGSDFFSTNTLKVTPFLRSAVFLTVAIIFSRITLERNRYFSELEMLNSAMCDVVTRVNAAGVIEHVSPSVEKVLGYSKEKLTGQVFFDLVHPEDRETIKNELEKVFETKNSGVFEHRFLCSNGDYIWAETIVTPVSTRKDGLNVYLFGSKDITLRKRAEEELKYLSIHDQLTGLYNRLMYEEELKRLKSGRFDPVGIIICDVDGLKIVNDNLGHDAGDLLLINAANILKKTCRSSDTLARIGGDEFAILIQNCDRDTLEKVCNRIKKTFNESSILDEIGTRVFISIGCAMGDTKTTPIHEIQKKADENMYREKAKNRKYVLDALCEAINAKQDLHGERVCNT